jgi:hypothetical protein
MNFAIDSISGAVRQFRRQAIRQRLLIGKTSSLQSRSLCGLPAAALSVEEQIERAWPPLPLAGEGWGEGR